jgi:hypothetical protein
MDDSVKLVVFQRPHGAIPVKTPWGGGKMAWFLSWFE